MDDGHRLATRVRHVLALHAILRVAERLLPGPFGDPDTLQPDREAGLVHHDEHVLEPAVRLTDQPADRAFAVAEGEHGRRAGMDAELVLDRHAAHVVARARAAVVVEQELRYQEQRDALHAGGRVGQPREHEVHDVLGHVVLTVRDEDLLAVEAVAAGAVGLGAGADESQVRPGLRLGQVHGAGPAAFDQVRQVALPLLVGAAEQQRLDRAAGQQRAQRERQVGAHHHLLDRARHQLRQALAPVLRRKLESVPPAGDELRIGFLGTRRRRHLAVAPGAAAPVAFGVDRREHLRGELCGLVEDRFGGVGAGVLEAWQRRHVGEAGEFAEDELHIAQRRAVGVHGDSLRRSPWPCPRPPSWRRRRPSSSCPCRRVRCRGRRSRRPSSVC